MFDCECGRSFSSKRSLGQHRRFCNSYISPEKRKLRADALESSRASLHMVALVLKHRADDQKMCRLGIEASLEIIDKLLKEL